jgi:hypothetical protein
VKNKSIPADELMARLNADPKYQARRAEQEAAFQRRATELRQAEAPLIEELQSVGINVKSVWDLVNKVANYPTVLPILFKHLERPYPPGIRDGIARALAVPKAKFRWGRLVELYQQERQGRAKDGLASALAAIADQETLGDLIALTRNVENGPSRLLLLDGLERLSASNPRAEKTLEELEQDSDLTKEIAVRLARMKKRRMKKSTKEKTLSTRSSGVVIGYSAGASEASMNFDANMVGPFLERLSALSIGLGPAEIDQVLKVVDEMEVDDERALQFKVKHEGQKVPMTVSVFKDDVDAVDLYFFAPRKLVEEINKLMRIFSAENGI